MEAAATPKNRTGTGQCSPEIIQLQQQDLIPAVELSSREGGLGVRTGAAQLQDLKSLRGLPVDPSGLHKQQLLCLLPSDAVKQGESKAQGTPSAQTRAGCAPAASRPQFLRPVPPADEPQRHTDSQLPQPRRENWILLLREPGCSHLGKEKDSGKQ